MKMRLLVLAFLWFSGTLFAQDYFPENDGVKSKNNNYTAFTNAKIYVTPTQIIEAGTLLIQNGKVKQVGKSVTIPKNSVIVDAKGHFIYPSFIDVYSKFGVEQPPLLSLSTMTKKHKNCEKQALGLSTRIFKMVLFEEREYWLP